MNNHYQGTLQAKPQKKQLVLALSLMLAGTTSQANTYSVTESIDDGTGLVAGSLSEAIFLANQNPGPDHIELQTDVAITGVMKRLIDSDITLTSDAVRRQISGEQTHRPLFIRSGQVVINDVDFREGFAQGGSGSGLGAGLGGAVFVYSGQVTFENVGFIANSAQGGTSGSRGGGGMFGSANGYGGGGLFGSSQDGTGGYGGYGYYQSDAPKFGEGGSYSSQSSLRNGGFGGGGGFINDGGAVGGHGGFGGGGGYSYYHDGGDGGFGGGAGFGGSIYGGVNGTPGYGGFGRFAAGMGGAVFVRTGTLTVTDSVFLDNMALSSGQGGTSDGLGGALFVLHSTTNSNGNNQGMPDELPTVQGCGLSLINNLASTSQNEPNNNHDLFDLADRVMPLNGAALTNSCDGIVPEIEVTGNLVEIIDGDDSPEIVDGTDFGAEFIGSSPLVQSFEVRNNGQKILYLNGSSPVELTDNDSGQFSVIEQPAALIGAGQSSVFTVQFDPQVSGLTQARVVINSNDSDEAEFDYVLQANAITSEADIRVAANGVFIEDGDASPAGADLTDFGMHEISDPAYTAEWTITNAGSTVLDLTGSPPVELSGAGSAFTVSSQPGITELSPGESTTFAISYDPVVVGNDSAMVLIANNTSNAPIMDFMIQAEGVDQSGILSVLGNGLVIPVGDRTPRPEDFTMMGYTSVSGNSLTRTFEINNRGDGVLELFGVSVFSASDTISLQSDISSQTLNPDESTFFSLNFDPENGGGSTPAFVQVFGADFTLLSYFEVAAFGQPVITVRADETSVIEGNSATFTVTSDVVVSESIPYVFEVFGQQVDGADFGGTLPSGEAYLTANSDSSQIVINTVQDGVFEGQESFVLQVSPVDQRILTGVPDVAGVVIDDDLIFLSDFDELNSQPDEDH
jgi:hypothetical protein